MKIISCNKEYAVAILAILNEAIINSTALYDYRPRSLASMDAWFDSKSKGNFPVIGLVDDDAQLLGFGSYGTFRAWPAYKYSVEHSLYVHQDFRGKGYGKVILREIINHAQQQNYHTLIAGIDASNNASKILHENFGFTLAGRIKHAGYKFSRWLDLEFYQLLLATPETPTED
jgi:phosphinothricin acetyltransferase